MTMMQNYATQAESQRPNSVEPIVSVNLDSTVNSNQQPEMVARPLSSMGGRTKKKKKKKKVRADHSVYTNDDNYSATVGRAGPHRDDYMTRQMSDLDTSTQGGGVQEVDDVAYRTDAVQ